MSHQQGGSRKISFNVSEQYDIQDVVGEGAYGVVCSALHKPSGQKVAIKKITPFDHSMFCLRTLREMKLLRYLALPDSSDSDFAEAMPAITGLCSPLEPLELRFMRALTFSSCGSCS